ncbi:hypothetical protein NECAME_04410 [Necator americanus]|uniref:Uncharacterized protein n=1 Tax=Necator americanus TaxID=51031 RepID=W2STJ6_NECAM|nr:hypothetical protein NECAME_04410 [Necator americanus]ETN72803.1 hypothetical protein NECAME_04410 [Necator americanus]
MWKKGPNGEYIGFPGTKIRLVQKAQTDLEMEGAVVGEHEERMIRIKLKDEPEKGTPPGRICWQNSHKE